MAGNKSQNLRGVAYLAMVTAAMAFGINTAPANAQTEAPPPLVTMPTPAPSPIRYASLDPLLQSLRPNTVRERYISQIVTPLRQADQGSDGLDKKDIEWLVTIDMTRARANRIGQILQQDFDGDWQITADEMMRFTPVKDRERAQLGIDRVMKQFDLNEDGVATLEEASLAESTNRRSRNTQLAALLELDPNGDGRLTASELRGLAEKTFDRFDSNGNGTIDREEAEPLGKVQRAAQETARLKEAGCEFVPASAGAQLVFIGTYSGQKISTAYIGSPQETTSVIDVNIEPGNAPLYIFLGSREPAIWRFSGATKRVEHVALAARKSVNRPSGKQRAEINSSSAGAIGLPAKTIGVLSPDCLMQLNSLRPDRRDKVDILGQIIADRPADVIGKVSNRKDIALPSLTALAEEDPAEAMPSDFGSQRWKSIQKGYGDELVEIEPKTVVAAEPVGSYAILPGHHGIAQLVDEGTLVADDKSRLLITRDLAQWPAGLAGGHSVTFIAVEGVTIPEEKPGHSCVISEAEAASDDWVKTCRGKRWPRPKPRG